MKTVQNNHPLEITPRKRKDLRDLLDLLSKWDEAISITNQAEKQVIYLKELSKIIVKRSIVEFLIMIFYFKEYKIMKINQVIKQGEILSNVSVKEKTKNIYHRNALDMEAEFDEIFEEMNQRYDSYLSSLQKIHNKDYSEIKKVFNENELPFDDISLLLEKVRTCPPSSKSEKIALYLSMEECLYRALNS